MNESARKLAEKVLELDKVCDKSKLDDIELEHIKELADLARMITADLSAYDQVTVIK